MAAQHAGLGVWWSPKQQSHRNRPCFQKFSCQGIKSGWGAQPTPPSPAPHLDVGVLGAQVDVGQPGQALQVQHEGQALLLARTAGLGHRRAPRRLLSCPTAPVPPWARLPAPPQAPCLARRWQLLVPGGTGVGRGRDLQREEAVRTGSSPALAPPEGGSCRAKGNLAGAGRDPWLQTAGLASCPHVPHLHAGTEGRESEGWKPEMGTTGKAPRGTGVSRKAPGALWLHTGHRGARSPGISASSVYFWLPS